MGDPTIPHLWSTALNETHTRMHRSLPPTANITQSDFLVDPFGTTRIRDSQDAGQMHALVRTLPFQCTLSVVLVFVACFIILICIQPPFTFNASKDTEDKHETRKFSATKSSLYALGATGVGCVVAVALYIFSYKQQKQRGKM